MNLKKIRIAAAQMRSTNQVEENLKTIFYALEEASKNQAHLIVFPENCLLMGEGKKMLLQNKNIIEKIALSLIQKWVKEFKIAVILGGVAIYEPKPRKFFNRLFFISENGKILCTYDKIHLFDVKVKGDRAYQESTTITPGKKPVLFRWKGLRFGLSICYDLRFPELYRKLSKKGAQVFVTPSSFTVPTGTAHWDVLTRARAIENLSYVIAPAQEGEHTNGRKTFGHTRIISPWGEVLQELKKGEGLVYEDIDLSFLEQKRAQLPALKHRKIT